MAFKLTYSDGHETDYDDETKWEVEDGVLKLGKESGKWSVFLSPSHWATLELNTDGDHKKSDDDKDKADSKDDSKDKADSKDKKSDDDDG